MIPTAGDWSVSAKARTAGALWLAVIAAGVFAELVVRSGLVVGGDAAATSRNVVASEALFRSGIAADIIAALCYAAVSLLLYDLFRPVQPMVARIALAFGLIGSTILAANLVNLYAPLPLLKDPALAAIGTGGREALALAALKLHSLGYTIATVFFAIQVSCLAYLVWRSNALPKVLGALLGIEGACGLFNDFAVILAPGSTGSLYPYILLPALLAEGGMALWLLTKGFGKSSASQGSRP